MKDFPMENKIKRRKMEKTSYTINELIEELQNLKLNLGTGDVEVALPQLSEDGTRSWNAHICFVEADENESGETIVKVY